MHVIDELGSRHVDSVSLHTHIHTYIFVVSHTVHAVSALFIMAHAILLHLPDYKGCWISLSVSHLH